MTPHDGGTACGVPPYGSFPRSAWKCSWGRSAARRGTRSVRGGIPTRSVGTREPPAAFRPTALCKYSPPPPIRRREAASGSADILSAPARSAGCNPVGTDTHQATVRVKRRLTAVGRQDAGAPSRGFAAIRGDTPTVSARGEAAGDALRPDAGRGASGAAFPRGAWERGTHPLALARAAVRTADPTDRGARGDPVGSAVRTAAPADAGAGWSAGAGRRRSLVPTLRVGMQLGTLRVQARDAERPGRHSHAERGNEGRARSPWRERRSAQRTLRTPAPAETL